MQQQSERRHHSWFGDWRVRWLAVASGHDDCGHGMESSCKKSSVSESVLRTLRVRMELSDWSCEPLICGCC
jgi:hypothetical protein